MFFFLKWVRILPEVDWYIYQSASPAPKIDKDPYKVKCHIRAKYGGVQNCNCQFLSNQVSKNITQGGQGQGAVKIFGRSLSKMIVRDGVKKKTGLFSDIDQKGTSVSYRNHYFLKP